MGTPENRGLAADGAGNEQIDLKILLVDDDASLLEEQADLLRSLGYTCLTAETPTAAEALFASDREINVIVADWSLPGKDGLSLIDQLRTSAGSSRHFVAVLQTGHPSVDLAVESMHSGVADFISKPINPRVVRSRVKTHLMLKFQSDLLRDMVFIDPPHTGWSVASSTKAREKMLSVDGDVDAVIEAASDAVIPGAVDWTSVAEAMQARCGYCHAADALLHVASAALALRMSICAATSSAAMALSAASIFAAGASASWRAATRACCPSWAMSWARSAMALTSPESACRRAGRRRSGRRARPCGRWRC